MNDLERRLNGLIVLCSALLGLAVTFLIFSECTSLWFLVYALVPTGMVVLVASRNLSD